MENNIFKSLIHKFENIPYNKFNSKKVKKRVKYVPLEVNNVYNYSNVILNLRQLISHSTTFPKVEYVTANLLLLGAKRIVHGD